VRKGLRKELKPSQSRTLKGDRKILLKRAHEVSDRERLIMETWTGAFPQLLAAYEHKERFYGIWDATTRLQAEAALDEWIATIPKGQKEVWSDLVRAVGKLRKLEKKNLDAAMLAALKQTNDFVLSQGKPLDPMSKAAYEDILARSGKNER
jgi:transposase